MRVASEIVLAEDERVELVKPTESGLTRVRLVQRPCIVMYFTPTSASWLNIVERLCRGLFTRVLELVAAIDEYVDCRNTKPKSFIWTKRTHNILQKVIRANSRLSSKQNAALR